MYVICTTLILLTCTVRTSGVSVCHVINDINQLFRRYKHSNYIHVHTHTPFLLPLPPFFPHPSPILPFLPPLPLIPPHQGIHTEGREEFRHERLELYPQKDVYTRRSQHTFQELRYNLFACHSLDLCEVL